MLDLTSISPHLHLRISPRARRLSLRLDARDRKIHLIVPRRASMKAAYQFALQNKSWIDEKLSTLPMPIPFHDGEVIPVLGRHLRIVIDQDDIYKVTKIAIEEDRLIVRTSLENPSPRIVRFLKKLAGEEFSSIASAKASSINRKITVLNLKDMKTRWGSCSIDGRMTLNWRLIFAPHSSYDYVIAHEVAHLTHSNHGKMFWKLCESLSDDFTEGSDWIRDNANELTRYG